MTDNKEEKKLTLKQRKWLKEYLECGSARAAALKVYDCTEETAGQIGWENMKKLDIAGAMEEAGLTTKMLFDKHREGLEATRTVSAVKTSREAGADSTDFIDVPDYAVRHKYLETAYKVKKILVDKDVNINVDNRKLYVQLPDRNQHPVETTSGATDGSA